ncbi:MAG: hypothetical protein KAT26_01745 [Marinosulfonomonas sp.]|nr:hypothetical protein [Marinosulfonomonas sp.]
MRLTVLALLTLTACEVPAFTADETTNDCDAAGYQSLIGQSADILASMTFPAPIRIIKPGMAVTMDYSPDRLNVDLDAQNRITHFWCG